MVVVNLGQRYCIFPLKPNFLAFFKDFINKFDLFMTIEIGLGLASVVRIPHIIRQ